MKTGRMIRKIRTIAHTAPRTTADQWVALAAVVDEGGYATAAEALDRSQSAVSYQVTRLQQALRCRLLEVRRRRVVLTAQGEVLLARARGLLEEWRALETFAQSLERGFEATLKVIVDGAFPRARLLAALLELKRRCPSTQLDLSEVVLSGAEEAIINGAVDGSAAGLAYAWLPEHTIGTALAAGRLKPLPLESGASRKVPLYLVLVRPSEAGPAARMAVELLHQFALGDAADAR